MTRTGRAAKTEVAEAAVDGRQERSAVTREALLRAAIEEFAEEGMAGARVDRIAANARANKQALYYHFGSKEKLFKAVLALAYQELTPDVAEILEGRHSAVERARALIEGVFDRTAARTWALSVISYENLHKGAHLDQDLREAILQSTGPMSRAIRDVVQQGKAEGVFDQEVDAYWFQLELFALIMFYFTNRYTAAFLSGRDLSSPDAMRAWRSKVVQNALQSLTKAD